MHPSDAHSRNHTFYNTISDFHHIINIEIKTLLQDIDMLYNEYNNNNQYAIKIMSIAIVFLEISTF